MTDTLNAYQVACAKYDMAFERWHPYPRWYHERKIDDAEYLAARKLFEAAKVEYLSADGSWTNYRIMRLLFLSRQSADDAKRKHGGYVAQDTNQRQDDIESAMRVFRARRPVVGESA